MRLYLISVTKLKWSRLNKYRMMKPLNLLTLARLTPPDWIVEVIDENLGLVDYRAVAASPPWRRFQLPDTISCPEVTTLVLFKPRGAAP